RQIMADEIPLTDLAGYVVAAEEEHTLGSIQQFGNFPCPTNITLRASQPSRNRTGVGSRWMVASHSAALMSARASKCCSMWPSARSMAHTPRTSAFRNPNFPNTRQNPANSNRDGEEGTRTITRRQLENAGVANGCL